MTESFDIQVYDESSNIAEIKVIDKIDDGYEERLAKYQNDTIGWNKEYPPIPMLPPNNFTEFNVEVIEVFKGNLKKGKIKLRVIDKNSSCYWEPKTEKSYIFYFGERIDQKGIELIQIGGCQRRIRTDSNNYLSEANALRIFKDKNQGKFVVEQSDLINPPNKPYFSVKGKFKNGKRHGKWIIAEPIGYSKKETKHQEKVLILKYKNGKLMAVKYFKPNNNHTENYFIRHWKYYYEERKTVANKG